MVWRILGDSAWLCEPGGKTPRQRLDRIFNLKSVFEEYRIPEIDDIVAAYETISVHFNPSHGELVLDWIKSTSFRKPSIYSEDNKTIEIPTDYHHPTSELQEIAHQLHLPPDEIINLHSSSTYEVAAIGFSPGFPYLIGLDPRLQLPRKTTPNRVPAGAVAIANHQAGIYPNSSFGGWHVVGVTNLSLFDPNRHPPTLLQPGDKLRFIPSSNLYPIYREQVHWPSHQDVLVLHPGIQTTIQDLGRPGYRAQGISPGGTTDPISARVANRILGNSDNEAVLECAGCGPILRFLKPTTVSWLGWQKGSGKQHHFAIGQTLDLRGKMNFSRGIIAFQGGIIAPEILNSLSTDVRASFGGHHGRALLTNDTLTIGDTHDQKSAKTNLHVAWPRTQHHLHLRYIKGIQHASFHPESINLFKTSHYQTSSSTDRTATRLIGNTLKTLTSTQITSQPVIQGSIQVPPDGKPIILLSECQTIGGYPQIGHIISADIPALARALPGTPISFQEVSLEEAREAWQNLHRELCLLKAGISLLQ